MKILKHGKRNSRKFACINCGCEFVAVADEYFREETYGVVFYRCNCPECTFTPETSEPWEEEDDRSGLVLSE